MDNGTQNVVGFKGDGGADVGDADRELIYRGVITASKSDGVTEALKKLFWMEGCEHKLEESKSGWFQRTTYFEVRGPEATVKKIQGIIRTAVESYQARLENL